MGGWVVRVREGVSLLGTCSLIFLLDSIADLALLRIFRSWAFTVWRGMPFFCMCAFVVYLNIEVALNHPTQQYR